MFKHKKEYHFTFLLEEEEILNCKLHELPIKEDIVLQYSIEYFNDSAPCFIHRSAVITRLIAEIEKSMESFGENFILQKNEIPEQITLWVKLEDYDSIKVIKK